MHARKGPDHHIAPPRENPEPVGKAGAAEEPAPPLGAPTGRQHARVVVNALALHGAADAARVFLENLILGFPRAWPEAEVVVVLREGCQLPDPGPRVDTVTFKFAGSGPSRVANEFLRLPALIRRLEPDVVINPNESIPPRLDCGLVVISQNLFFHCPALGPLQTGPFRARMASRLQFGFYRRQMPRAYQQADAVITVSAHAANELSEHAGLDLSRTHVVHYGADRLPLKARLAPGGPRRLLIVGAIAHYKRLQEAVEALRILRAGGGDYELHLAGEAWPGYRDVVVAAATRAGVAENVRFRGALDAEDLASAFATSHAGLALSACESFGIPLVEGMRAGLPHVVAREPWSAETVGDAAVGVDASDPESVAAGVRELEEPAEWARRAEAGRRATERYTWTANAEGIARVAAAVAATRCAPFRPSVPARRETPLPPSR